MKAEAQTSASGSPEVVDSPLARRRRRSTRLTVLLLVAAAGWGGWLAARAGLDVGAYYTDGERAFGTTPAVRSAVWRDPELLVFEEPLQREASRSFEESQGLDDAQVSEDSQGSEDPQGTVSSQIDAEVAPEQLADANHPAATRRPTISPDGRFLVFSAGARGSGSDLFVSERRESGWSEPQPLVELNSDGDDMAPSFGPKALYFSSDRGPFKRGLDLWRADWDQLGFGAAKRLEPWVQSDVDDTDPVLLDNGALIFASKRNGPDFDLFEAATDGVRALDALNSSDDEREPTGSAGGSVLWFASDRDGGAGQFDPFQSFLGRSGWMAPRRVRELATAASERGLWVEPDGFTLLFERGDANGNTIMSARSREIYEMPAPAIGWREMALLAALLVLALGAWLSRRYSGLEFLTRCILLSLVLHLGLLWWLRDVHPEAPGMIGAGDETRYAVTLVADTGGQENEGRSSSAQTTGPTRRAVSRTEPTVVARSVRARSADRSTNTEQRQVAEPETATSVEQTQVALPSVAARTFEQAAEAPAKPHVTGGARAVRQNSPALARRSPSTGASAPRVVSTTSPRNAVRPPRAAVGATAPSPLTAQAGLASSSIALDQRVTLPTIERTLESAQGQSTPAETQANLAPVAFADQSIRIIRGPERSQRAGARRLDPSSRAATLQRRASASSSGSYQPNRPENNTAIASTPARLMPLVEQSARTPAVASQPTGVAASPRSVSFERTRVAATAGPRRRNTERAPLIADAGTVSLERRVATIAGDRAARPVVAPVYQNRFGEERELAVTRFGGDAQTERSVRLGLEYLASIQRSNGGWGRRRNDDKYGDLRTGKSGLALLAFLGAGHVPGAVPGAVPGTALTSSGAVPGKHAETVQRAVDFLLSQQQEGGHFGESNAYGHGIATYALCEAFALTRLESLREPIQRAVAHMLEYQVSSSQERLHGGWGYYTQTRYGDGDDRWPRVSVTAWQVMALVSARTSGFEVPVEALSDAKSFLLASWDDGLGAYRYTHDPERLNSAYPTLPASTPAALFALSLLGENVASERFAEPRRFVLDRSPRSYRMRSNAEFVARADGNLYCWAYATLALFRVGGTPWKRWNAALKEVLLPAQKDDGSWPSVSVYGEYADDTDDAYSTALGVMMMEVYYRYVTPTVQPSKLR